MRGHVYSASQRGLILISEKVAYFLKKEGFEVTMVNGNCFEINYCPVIFYGNGISGFIGKSKEGSLVMKVNEFDDTEKERSEKAISKLLKRFAIFRIEN